jgi:hypothetical protein
MEDENGRFRWLQQLMEGTYYFDQFNVDVGIPKYTDEEYEQYLQGMFYII